MTTRIAMPRRRQTMTSLSDRARHPFWVNVGRKAELKEEVQTMPAWALGLITSVLPSLFSAADAAITHLLSELGAAHPASSALQSAKSAVASASSAVASAASAK
jgi:hypothetical protein